MLQAQVVLVEILEILVDGYDIIGPVVVLDVGELRHLSLHLLSVFLRI